LLIFSIIIYCFAAHLTIVIYLSWFCRLQWGSSRRKLHPQLWVLIFSCYSCLNSTVMCFTNKTCQMGRFFFWQFQ